MTAGRSRDPVSELMDSGARRLLARAYASPGRWQGTRLAAPGDRHRAWARSRGIDIDGPDPVPRGGLNARSRWARGFVRSLYHHHRWYSDSGGLRSERRTSPRNGQALQVEVGRAVGPLGVLPAGRAIRVRVVKGGDTARAALGKLPDSRRIYTPDGAPAGRWAEPSNREWY